MLKTNGLDATGYFHAQWRAEGSWNLRSEWQVGTFIPTGGGSPRSVAATVNGTNHERVSVMLTVTWALGPADFPKTFGLFAASYLRGFSTDMEVSPNERD